MKRKATSAVIRFAALLLVMVLLLPVGARTALAEAPQTRASDYLNSYSAYVYPAANGKIQVWFNVTGTGYIECIGALSIRIYESKDGSNWTWCTTFLHENNPGMLSYNDNYHSGHVDYQGVVGRYYRAYVCIWGGGLEVGDARYFYTSAKKAVQTPS